jgi:hypothetical protein
VISGKGEQIEIVLIWIPILVNFSEHFVFLLMVYSLFLRLMLSSSLIAVFYCEIIVIDSFIFEINLGNES